MSNIPTEEELGREMTDDELRRQTPDWVAYYCFLRLLNSSRSFHPHPDPWGGAKQRLRELFPDLEETRIGRIMEGAGITRLYEEKEAEERAAAERLAADGESPGEVRTPERK